MHGRELISSQGNELYYWARNAPGGTAEVDYLFENQGRVFPVEVKSGKGGSLRSIHVMLQRYPECPEGLVLYSGDYAERLEQKLRFISIYPNVGVYYAGSLSLSVEKDNPL